MTDTANLALPCIDAAQAQKHVTHNEALRILDTLVQLACRTAISTRRLARRPIWLELDRQGQPEPDRGSWSGHGNQIAAWQDGAWQFSAPKVNGSPTSSTKAR